MRRLKSLKKIVKEEVLKKRSNILDNTIFDYDNIDDNPDNVMEAAPRSPIWKLKIRNITKYLNWCIAILKLLISPYSSSKLSLSLRYSIILGICSFSSLVLTCSHSHITNSFNIKSGVENVRE